MNYIWDFDGTLYDTYPIMLKALMETFKEFGIEKDEKEVYQKIKTESIGQMIIDWRLPVPILIESIIVMRLRKIGTLFLLRRQRRRWKNCKTWVVDILF